MNQECHTSFELVVEGNKLMRNNSLQLRAPWVGGSENRETGSALVDWDEHN